MSDQAATRMMSVKGLSLLYTRCLLRSPCLTKALTAGVLNALEEISAQRLAQTPAGSPPSALDSARVLKMALYGLLLSGPLSHYLYQMLEDFFGNRTGAVVAILKILASNVVIAPIQNLVYVVAIGVIGKLGSAQMDEHVRSTFWAIMKQTWIIFPLVSASAQLCVPASMHTPFYSLTGFLFGVYCNLKSRSSQRKEKSD